MEHNDNAPLNGGNAGNGSARGGRHARPAGQQPAGRQQVPGNAAGRQRAAGQPANAAQQRAAAQRRAAQQNAAAQQRPAGRRPAPGQQQAAHRAAGQYPAGGYPAGNRAAQQRPAGTTPINPANPAMRQGRRPAPGAYQQPYYQDAAGAYNRDDLVRVKHKRKKHRTAKRVAIIVAAVLVVLIGSATAFGLWYMNTIGGNMAMDQEDAQKLDEALRGNANDVSSQAFYVLVMGSDNWETYGERSDAMILTRVDPVKHVVTMVSVPRDTPYYLNGNKVKINEAFAQNGPAGAVQAVQELTGVPISYYAEIEFAGLSEFVDSIGGIYVDVPYAFDYQVYTQDQPVVHIDAGEQLLNGEECVALARMRTAYGDNQDATRQSNVRAMALALINSVLQASPMEIPGLIQNLSNCVSTNFDMNELIDLATNFATAGGTTVYTCTGPYDGAIDEETGLWLCYENPEGWASLMEKVEAGEDPSSVETQVEGK